MPQQEGDYRVRCDIAARASRRRSRRRSRRASWCCMITPTPTAQPAPPHDAVGTHGECRAERQTAAVHRPGPLQDGQRVAGKPVADQLLIEIARRLQDCRPPTSPRAAATIVLLPDLPTAPQRNGVDALLARVRANMSSPRWHRHRRCRLPSASASFRTTVATALTSCARPRGHAPHLEEQRAGHACSMNRAWKANPRSCCSTWPCCARRCSKGRLHYQPQVVVDKLLVGF